MTFKEQAVYLGIKKLKAKILSGTSGKERGKCWEELIDAVLIHWCMMPKTLTWPRMQELAAVINTTPFFVAILTHV